MNLSGLVGSNKLFYILAGAIVFIVIITVIIIIGSVGGGSIEKAKLEFWGVYDSRHDFADTIKAYQQVDPQIKVTYSQYSFEDYEKALIDALAAGKGPDIIMFHHTWLAKHRSKLSPMSEVSTVKDYKFMTITEFKSQFVDVAADDLIFQDRIYGLPLYVDTLAVFYNKDMFNTAGITRPPKNWEEFNDAVKLMTKFDRDGNIIRAGAALGTARTINRSTDILASLMIQNGTQMTNTAKTAVTFTRTVSGRRVGEEALEYYTDFANPKKEVYTWNDRMHYSIDAFVEGKAAMMINYSHQIPATTRRFERLNFGISPLPQFSDLDAKNYANYWAVGVSSQSPSKEAAWRFLNYLASRDGILPYLSKTLRPSARRDVIDVQRNDPRLGVFALQALSAKSWFQVDSNAIDQIFADMIDEVNFKKATIRQALRAAEAKIGTLMARLPR